jgi:hypothetical protein
MFHEGEPAARPVAVDHEPHANRSEERGLAFIPSQHP